MMASAADHARDLLGRLPPEIPTPEWVYGSDGAMIGLDWHLGPRRQVSVDVHDTHLEVTALIDLFSSAEQIAYDGGPIPPRVLDLLHQLTAPA